MTDAEARADALVQNLKKPRPDLFETPWWQFFSAQDFCEEAGLPIPIGAV